MLNLPVFNFISQSEAINIAKIIKKQFAQCGQSFNDNTCIDFLVFFDRKNPAPYINLFNKLASKNKKIPSKDEINKELEPKRCEAKEEGKMHDSVLDLINEFYVVEKTARSIAAECVKLALSFGVHGYESYKKHHDGFFHQMTRDIADVSYRDLLLIDLSSFSNKKQLLLYIETNLKSFFEDDNEFYLYAKTCFKNYKQKDLKSESQNILRLPNRKASLSLQ